MPSISVAPDSSMLARVNNVLRSNVHQDMPRLGTFAAGLATTIASASLAGSLLESAPSEIKALMVPVIALYSTLSSAAAAVLADKFIDNWSSLKADIISDAESGKIKQA